MKTTTRVLHVFGRTYPHTAHLLLPAPGKRRLVWTPWEKVELDIEGDHLIPVIWNGKLMLIWPIFTEKAGGQAGHHAGAGQQLDSAGHVTTRSSSPGANTRAALERKSGVGSGDASWPIKVMTTMSLRRSRGRRRKTTVWRASANGGLGDASGPGRRRRREEAGRPGSLLPLRHRRRPGPKPLVPHGTFSFKALAVGDDACGARLLAPRLSQRDELRRCSDRLPVRRISIPRLPQDRDHDANQPASRPDEISRSRRPGRSSIACGSPKLRQRWSCSTGTFRHSRRVLPTRSVGIVNEPASIAGRPRADADQQA